MKNVQMLANGDEQNAEYNKVVPMIVGAFGARYLLDHWLGLLRVNHKKGNVQQVALVESSGSK